MAEGRIYRLGEPWTKSASSAGRVGAKRRIEAKRLICRAAHLVSIRYATQPAPLPQLLDTPVAEPLYAIGPGGNDVYGRPERAGLSRKEW